MIRSRYQGFTIIEVILFLALSSVLLAVVISTIGGRQERVQFTDSMRDLQAFVETQLSNTQNGVNDSPGTCVLVSGSYASTGGNSEECLILGRALVFNTGSPANQTMTVHTVFGKRLSAEDETSPACTGISSLACSTPYITETGAGYGLLWGAHFTDGWWSGGSVSTRAFAFLRDPRATSIIPVTYNMITNPITAIRTRNNYNVSADAQRGDDVSAYYCFISGDGRMRAALTIVGTQIDMVFDPSLPTYQCSGV